MTMGQTQAEPHNKLSKCLSGALNGDSLTRLRSFRGKEDERPTAAGLGFADAVKFTIMLADMRRWAEFNAVYVTYFDPSGCRRVRPCASGLALGGEVEVECVAY
jgi:Endoribonuclease L-PSP